MPEYFKVGSKDLLAAGGGGGGSGARGVATSIAASGTAVYPALTAALVSVGSVFARNSRIEVTETGTYAVNVFLMLAGQTSAYGQSFGISWSVDGVAAESTTQFGAHVPAGSIASHWHRPSFTTWVALSPGGYIRAYMPSVAYLTQQMGVEVIKVG